jgi:hypothetical protein
MNNMSTMNEICKNMIDLLRNSKFSIEDLEFLSVFFYKLVDMTDKLLEKAKGEK